jgi:hypothetical protein
MISQFRYDLRQRVWNGQGRMTETRMTGDCSPAPLAHAERKPLPPAARRALAEAEARRKAAEADPHPMPKELQGPKGPEPTRYGDWENKGIASDF